MSNPTKTTYPDTFFCSGDASKFAPGFKVTSISEEYPIWSANMKDGPHPINGFDTGELLLCPRRLTLHPPARAIGPGRSASGIVCEECRTIFALQEMDFESYPHMIDPAVVPRIQ